MSKVNSQYGFVPIALLAVLVFISVLFGSLIIVSKEETQKQEQSVSKISLSPLPNETPILSVNPTASPRIFRATAKPTPKPTIRPTPRPTPTPTLLGNLEITKVTIQKPGDSVAFIPGSDGMNNWQRLAKGKTYTLYALFQNTGGGTSKTTTFSASSNGSTFQSGSIPSLSSQQTFPAYISLPSTTGNYSFKLTASGSTDTYSFTYQILRDYTGPTMSFDVYREYTPQGTCVTFEPNDNFDGVYDMHYEASLDGEAFANILYRPDPSLEPKNKRCIEGTSGEHAYAVKATDSDGNATTSTRTFQMLPF
ncbi:MAG TPA: CARDB domain-containing protein [Patescibacteria group bacterium]|nr:CARDB domain-containing protein [Patescibacteria group bacterium]